MVRTLLIISVAIIMNDLCVSQLTEKNKNPPECGRVTSDDRITNGVNATLKQFPFMALLGYTRNVLQINLVQFFCGGTIITEDYVLTAAHCFNVSLTFVRLGELDIRNDTDCVVTETFVDCADPHVDILIKQKIIHSDYNPRNFENDIAIVKLSRRIQFSEYIQPICLPFDMDIRLAKSTLSVSGWGTTTSSTAIGSPILQYARIEVWSNINCENVLSPEVRPLKETQICGNGKNGQDACRGDSGGPLFTVKVVDFQPKYFQIGITSFGATNGCGNPELPSVYTKIDKYIDWITKNI